MLFQLRLDALLSGFISIFFVFVVNMAIIIAALVFLANHVPADLLYPTLKVISIISLALPPYVAARTADNQPILHGLIIGIIQSLIIVALMTQTASWEGTQQNNIIEQMPLVGGSLIILSLFSGMIAQWMNQKNKS